MEHGKQSALALAAFLGRLGKEKTTIKRCAKRRICTQGDPALSLFCVQEGTVGLAAVSRRGKSAIVALLGPGDFFGEGCLAGQTVRSASATCFSDCTVIEIEKKAMLKALRATPSFAEDFLCYVLARNIRYQEDLIDQLSNKSEKRLARLLVLLARLDTEGEPQPVIPRISQEALAEMIGTTRGRVSTFMANFKKMGMIDYNGGIRVHKALLDFLHTE
jgi:CRP/FNR family transcriptional regulator, cyclic AMP receptor protein